MLRRRALALLAAGLSGGAAVWAALGGTSERAPIRVGVLHSLTGTMAISERAVADATLLALEAINASGGLLGGRKVVPVAADGASSPDIFAREAERLILRDKVSVIFGCGTSASRRTVLPVLEQHNHLLFYPVGYEGLEMSPAVIYTGAAPNQQILPAVKWAMDHLGTSFFLVGSDQVFARTAAAIIMDQVAALGGVVVGEEYALLGDTDFRTIVRRIVGTQPAVILNTVEGDSNIAFFSALRAAGVSAATMPTLSFSLTENEIQAMDRSLVAGDYTALNYFQSIDNPENRRFVQQFQARFGAHRAVGDPMQAAFFGVHLWAQAVEQAGTESVRAVRDTVKNQSFAAPGGVVYVDPETQHCWKAVRIGRIRPNGQFDIMWNSEKPVRPVPYPTHRTRDDWDQFIARMQAGWGGRWNAPDPIRRS